MEANENIAMRVFVLADDKISLTYHRNAETVTCSTREYYKPPQAEEKGGNLPWTPDMTMAFMVGYVRTVSAGVASVNGSVRLGQGRSNQLCMKNI